MENNINNKVEELIRDLQKAVSGFALPAEEILSKIVPVEPIKQKAH